MTHLDDFDTKLFGLLALMGIHRADADLDETFSRALLHDAGEWAGMRQAIAFEFVVEVGVSVEVDDGQAGNALSEGADDGQGDGVIAAQADGPQVVVEELADFGFDSCEGRLEIKFQIAGVSEHAFLVEVDAGFGR